MESSNNLNNKIITFGFLGLAGFFTYKMLTKKPDAELDQGWQPEKNAHIKVGEAAVFAQRIKNAFGYTWTDWDAIASVFEQFWNKDDVAMVYKAFGIYNGPAFINGDMFACLNAAYQYTTSIGYSQDIASIKAHCYELSDKVLF